MEKEMYDRKNTLAARQEMREKRAEEQDTPNLEEAEKRAEEQDTPNLEEAEKRAEEQD
eukprot:CAMPEP_0117427938 /NCGR_PEP_ID=MMETSP0758-20121206/7726_1 /TAXON_ID=63605 /ORGANISM="Percolomonas cosmopolitus, Strain AE-1 (ATCC 50343)" /LENGTH=57 /DNA_ID=CAMNT_0005213955 /DNA_START=317 /DNA_END=487 /DNA_ORIENTATION=-